MSNQETNKQTNNQHAM